LNDENLIVPVLEHSEAARHLFDLYCLKLKLVSCALSIISYVLW